MALQGVLTGEAIRIENSSVFIPELWSNEIRRNRDSRLFMRDFVEVEPFEGKKGDILHIPIVDDVSVFDKHSQTPVTFQAQDSGDFTMIIDKYKEVSFLIEDIVTAQSKYNLRSIWQERAGYALAKDVDSYILGLRGAIPTTQWIIGTDNGLLTGVPQALSNAMILAAIQLLDEADVPDGPGERMLTTSPGAYIDLLNIDKFIDRDYIGDTARPIPTGQLGTIYGMNARRTSQIKANSLTGYKNGKNGPSSPTPGVLGSMYVPSQEPLASWGSLGTGVGLPRGQTGSEVTRPFATTMICHKSWAKWGDSQKVKTESGRMIEYQADALVNTQIYGGKTYRQDHVVLIHHSAL